MNKQENMNELIRRHGETINNYFGLQEDPIKLCKKLRRYETKANSVMVDYCNGKIDYNDVESFILNWLKPKLEKALGSLGINSIYINHDPRGYTLKLNEIESKRVNGYKDWGGYFILAPDFREE